MPTKSTTEEFLQKARLIHGSYYDYSAVEYKNCYSDVLIICSKHGVFDQTPSNHLNGKGCPECGEERRTSSNQQFLEKARAIHGDKYDYSLLEYKCTHSKVLIGCSAHGIFNQSPANHLKGQGCPVCGIEKQKQACLKRYGFENPSRRYYSPEVFFNLASSDYLYEEYIVKEKTTIQIANELCVDPTTVCNYLRKHEIVIRQVALHSYKCIQWLESIMEKEGIFIQHAQNGGEYRVPDSRLHVDGYHKETNTIYEFYGDCWHGNPKLFKGHERCHPFNNTTAGELYYGTLQREKIIRELGYNLVTVWESECI